ncbi:MAG: xanthine dehydrogenase family protein molybdopterin-binding subunit [Rhodocyclaceae bacterium]|nr:xanthine dehydrogenase family protein molybdopterin-binding subunit [Rhodocyclaceae bacterium]MCA3074761.1 xanthine dehydrogenase family protein molybdopterin-binding subunit [Rhodocyclaceae bacterium]MCA3091613.1 xanthine dehydrogenase family protein molybdopterin-binding subunit [Rhodocyclaceae bacterium]MCA3093965.1 xanthine dehydrogenase family protein molybdopterin-binding subunit [Rhodocyclaceae bacterium]MCA3099244.1 xanthine dehydrogenase family protein molybdopterin-binding subunit 
MTRHDILVGQPVERLEDLRFLTGRGQYVDDRSVDGMLHATLVRSALAHGTIRAIDTAAALALPGVHAVYTAADLGAKVPMIPMRMEANADLARFEQPVLAHGKVRYVGEPLALVVADTPAIAEDAAGLVAAHIEPLPVVLDRTGAERGDTLLFEQAGSNRGLALQALRGDASALDAAFRDAPYTCRRRFKVHRHTAAPMETRGLLAEWDAARQRLTVSGLVKVPFAIRALLATLLGMPESAIDAVESDCGGGFGMRGEFYPEDFLVPFAARRLGRAVKWIEDRNEHLLAITHAREVECELEIACDRDGTIRGLRGQGAYDLGAYIRPNAVTAPRNFAQMAGGPYRIPALHMEVALLVSNKTPAGSYRGPGRFETDCFRERLFDIAAGELGIDRVAFRRHNLLRQDEMPSRLPIVMPYGSGGETDSGNYHETFERCLAEIGWNDKVALAGRQIDGVFHGIAIGCYIEGGGSGPREHARLVYEGDGRVAVHVGSSAVGQGLETIFAQIAADALGLPMDRISAVRHGSSGIVKMGYGSLGSRSTVMGGSAILDAANNLQHAIRTLAAARLGCAPEEVSLEDGLRSAAARGRVLALAGPSGLAGGGIEADGLFENDRRTYSYGSHAAHLTVDAATGQVRLLDYVSVEDVGRIINPMTLHGQVIGAIVQALGGTLLEHLVYDGQGQLLTGSLASYLVPAADDFPVIRSFVLENHPSPLNPLGVKGAGEGGVIPVGGVIANAIASALSSFGVQPDELPLTPPRIWELIRRGNAPVALP